MHTLPFLSNTIRKVVGKEIALVNRRVVGCFEQVLLNEDLLTDSSVQYRYYTSDSVDKFVSWKPYSGEEICNVNALISITRVYILSCLISGARVVNTRWK